MGVDVDAVETARSIVVELAMVAAGLVLLVIGANLLVRAAVEIAQSFGVSELVIGLTIIAVGTSLPEIATTVVAGARDHRDLAVGNAIGSNLFNILMVIGLSALIAPHGIPVAMQAVAIDMPIMIGIALVCLPIFWSGYCIDRGDGALLLGLYVLYTIYLYLSSVAAAQPAMFVQVCWFVIAPAVAMWLVVKIVRARKRT